LSTIAAVIPCYETSDANLRRAVESVRAERTLLARAGFTLTLIVVDDGSKRAETTKALADIERTHDDWCQVLRFGHNKGGAAARNFGVQASASAWIAFLDSDDYWLPGGLTRLVQAVESDSTITWISGDFRYRFNGLPEQHENVHQNHVVRGKYIGSAYRSQVMEVIDNPVNLFLETSLCSMGSCLISRDLFRRVGGFDERLRKGDDTELYWRLSRAAVFAFAPWPVFIYCRRENSVSNDGGNLSDWEPPVLGSMLSD